MNPRPFHFTLQRDITVPDDAWQTTRHLAEEQDPIARREALLALPRLAEAYGIDSLGAGDHFYDSPDALIDCMACAAATEKLIVSQTVLCNDFRNPALLAKMIASIDVFSAGRVELGIGCGYNPHEYRQADYRFDPHPVRAARMKEALHIIRALLDSDQPVTFKGEHYQIDGLLGLPRPAQKRIPIRIGGGGQAMLRIAAEFADVVDIMTVGLYPSGFSKDPWEFSKKSVASKIDYLKSVAGERFKDMALSIAVFRFCPAASLEEGARQAHQEMDAVYRMYGHADGFPFTLDDVVESPYFLVGTEDDMVKHLHDLRRDLGVTHHIILPAFLEGMRPVIARARADDARAQAA